jgi:hypothetical protein
VAGIHFVPHTFQAFCVHLVKVTNMESLMSIPVKMERGRYEGEVTHIHKGFFKTTGFQVSCLHKGVYLATAVFP